MRNYNVCSTLHDAVNILTVTTDHTQLVTWLCKRFVIFSPLQASSTHTQSDGTSSTTAMMDVDSMTSQGARVVYEKESHIVIDYSQLDEELKEVC